MDTRLHYFSMLRSSACKLHSTDPEKENIRRCIVDWILFREYWEMDDNIEKLSHRTGIPREEITEFLNDYTGKRYLALRKELRLEDAKQLILEHHELSVYEVAKMVGFADKSNFRKDFTEYVGVKPKIWKECNGNRLKCRLIAKS